MEPEVSPGLMAVVTTIYVAVALSELTKGNAPMSVVFISYACGNLGFIWSMLK